MNTKIIPGLLLVLILLVSCGAPIQTAIPASLGPTMVPSPIPTSTETTIPMQSVVINPASASKVVQLASFGDALFYDLTYSPDGKWLVVTTSLGLRFSDARTLTPIHPAGTETWGNTPVFSPDGKLVAFGVGKATVTILDFVTGAVVQTLSE